MSHKKARRASFEVALAWFLPQNVTRRVSEEAYRVAFFLANASGYEKCATSKRASEGHQRHVVFPRISLLALRACVAGATSKLARRAILRIALGHLADGPDFVTVVGSMVCKSAMVAQLLAAAEIHWSWP